MSFTNSRVAVVGKGGSADRLVEKLQQRKLPIMFQDLTDSESEPDVIVIHGENNQPTLESQLSYLRKQYDIDLSNEQIEYVPYYSFAQLITLLKSGHRNDRLFSEFRVRHIYVQTEREIQGIIGNSDDIQKLKQLIKRLAPSIKPILITGPTGSGKELVAKAIHDTSPLHEGPIVCVNCSAIPENLIESLLFGHEKGSFTGAEKQTDGYLKQASGGTLFLDELGEMPLLLQAKLLRVLETGRYTRIGGSQDLTFSGRIVAATHVNLEEAVANKSFREDLYYRLNVLTIQVPELNKRKEDIPLLIEHFTNQSDNPLPFTPSAIDYMQRLNWPGNVRELRNAVERLCLLTDADQISPNCISEILNLQPIDENTALDEMASRILSLDVADKTSTILNALLLRALRDSNGNKSEAARLLGVHRKVVERRYFSNQTYFEQELDMSSHAYQSRDEYAIY